MHTKTAFFVLGTLAIAGCGGGGRSYQTDGSCVAYLACLQLATQASGSAGATYQATLDQAITLYGAGSTCEQSDRARMACDTACRNGTASVAQAVGDGTSCQPTVKGMMMGTNHAKYAASVVTLPSSSSSNAYDIDGDGTADNRFGSILQAFAALSINVQAPTTAAVQSGALLLLFDELSTDPAQLSASGASVKLAYSVKPSSAPAFDGSDTFTINASIAPAQFVGDLTNGTFSSAEPATATTPVTFEIDLALIPGQTPLMLPITAGHLELTQTGGRLNGAVKKTDMDTIVLPALASLLNTQLQADPGNATLGMFDTNSDGTITIAELKSNALISAFIAPDVQLFTGGVYKPNPAKTAKDSLSIGIGFTVVGASF